MRFYIVDAFTDALFGGNPAGVVLIEDGSDFPDENLMRSTAAELRYSETAFVKVDGKDGFHTRYFTPTEEVDLCGHATIAAFTVMRHEGLVKPDTTVLNRTLAGDLFIRVEKDRVMMDMATPKQLGTLEDPPAVFELYKTLGIEMEPVYEKDAAGRLISLMPAILSTGLPDIILPVPTTTVLSKITPDDDALSALSRKYDVVGVHAFALTNDSTPTDSHEKITAYCRNFAPLYGIPEEAATGTSNGALTYYLYLHGLLSEDEPALFIQGREMNRPSRIESLLQTKDAALTVSVGGTGVLLAKGEMFI